MEKQDVVKKMAKNLMKPMSKKIEMPKVKIGAIDKTAQKARMAQAMKSFKKAGK